LSNLQKTTARSAFEFKHLSIASQGIALQDNRLISLKKFGISEMTFEKNSNQSIYGLSRFLKQVKKMKDVLPPSCYRNSLFNIHPTAFEIPPLQHPTEPLRIQREEVKIKKSRHNG